MTENPTDEPFDRLFAGVERRPEPSKAAREQALAGVVEEFEALQARRANRGGRAWMAIAAVMLAGAVSVIVLRQPAAPPMTLELAHGHVRVEDLAYRATQGPMTLEVHPGTPMRALGPTRWAAPGDADVRIGGGAEFAWNAPTAIELQVGGVYVETHGGTPFSVATPHGLVTDIGTRFLVTSDRTRMEVAVRDGRVELATALETRQSQPVTPGRAQILVAEAGVIAQATEAASHERWNWIHSAPKGYATRNPVTMLREIGRDLGKEIRFADGVEAALRVEELDGDYRDLAPWAAFRQVINVTAAGWRDENDVITISLED
ncbi:MAG: FecR family protein [Gammaproteobacteria bacterium]|nr:FecR family protein [Gammaproteobacteria bacterium]